MKDNEFDRIKVVNGQWGICYQDESLPLCRWDPFMTVMLKNGYKVGFQSVISQSRLKRPHEYPQIGKKGIDEQLSSPDSFCEIVKGKMPSVLISYDGNVVNDFYRAAPAYNDLRDKKVATIVNLYSPTARITGVKSPFHALGVSLVHIFVKHYKMVEDVDDNDLKFFFVNMRETVKAFRTKLLKDNEGKNNDKKEYFNIIQFFNIGPRAGASIPHLHAQTILLNSEKQLGWKNYYFLEAFKNYRSIAGDKDYCLACNLVNGIDDGFLSGQINFKDRIIEENREWIGFVAFSPERDYHLRIIPKDHVSAIWELSDRQVDYLVSVFKNLNYRLTSIARKNNDPFGIHFERNIIIRQTNLIEETKPHMLIEIIPTQIIGGAEMTDSLRITQLLPERVAMDLRRVR